MRYNAAMGYGQESCIRQGVFKVAPFDGLIFIYQTDPISSLSLSYTNFIMLRIYAGTLDRRRVRLNIYLV